MRAVALHANEETAYVATLLAMKLALKASVGSNPTPSAL
jgi:hypothetical protein